LTDLWYVDSSVVLRIVKEGSPAARRWFDQARMAGDMFIASQFMRLEVLRTLANAGLSLQTANDVISRFILLALDDALVDEAISLARPLRSADALHVASAMRVGVDAITLVTHDAQMANAAKALGFKVIVPETNEPENPAIDCYNVTTRTEMD